MLPSPVPSSQAAPNPGTLERLIPDEIAHAAGSTASETLALHLARYDFAAQHLRTLSPAPALDIACGVGYGSRHLAETCPNLTEVLGVDIDPAAIAYATRRYANERTRFLQADATTFQSPFQSPVRFTAIVSLETIEHLPDPRGFAAHLAKLLAPGGLLVASVPVTPSTDANPHHLSDFTPRTFRRLFSPHGLVEIAAFPQTQPFSPTRVATRAEPRMKDMRANLPAYYLRHPASFARRLVSTLVDGFNNKYLTVALRKPT